VTLYILVVNLHRKYARALTFQNFVSPWEDEAVGACRDGEEEDGEHDAGRSREVLCDSIVLGLFTRIVRLFYFYRSLFRL
jgi:hypothetical protein